jgi:hypothetical protein
VRLLREAAELWTELGRPLEHARCMLLVAHVLGGHDPAAAQTEIEATAAELERLGLAQLAAKARTQMAAG